MYTKSFLIVKAFQSQCSKSKAQNLKGPLNNKSKEFINKHCENLEFFKENENKEIYHIFK